MASETYEALAAEFDETHTDNRGGVELTYITGEQCCSRLNDVLGPHGWSFLVREHGINQEADECWALGRLEAVIDGERVVREQFGSQKIKRSRTSGAPLDIGFDLKGAATDALKKCATLIGVGLYLSHKEAKAQRGQQRSPQAQRADPVLATAERMFGGQAQPAPGADAIVCEDCGGELKETRFKDGTTWGPSQLAGYGRRKHGRVLCMDDYRKANDARKAAVEAGG